MTVRPLRSHDRNPVTAGTPTSRHRNVFLLRNRGVNQTTPGPWTSRGHLRRLCGARSAEHRWTGHRVTNSRLPSRGFVAEPRRNTMHRTRVTVELRAVPDCPNL